MLIVLKIYLQVQFQIPKGDISITQTCSINRYGILVVNRVGITKFGIIGQFEVLGFSGEMKNLNLVSRMEENFKNLSSPSAGWLPLSHD